MSAARRAVAVIPCLNEREHIARVIAELLDDPAWEAPSIIVADGGSTDGSREIVSEIAAHDGRVALLHNPGRLQSAGVNLAARLAAPEARYLVRADAHARYPTGYVSRLIAEAETTGAVSVVVAMRAYGEACFQQAAAAAQNSLIGAGGAPHRRRGPAGFVDHGHHALFDIEAFLAAGGYDEDFSHNEDAEFDARLAERGGRIWLTRDVEVAYLPRASAGALFRQYLNHGRGRARMLLKRRRAPKLRQALPLAVAPALALAPLAPLAAAPALAWAAISLGYGVWLGARSRSACALGAGAAAMIMHLAWSLGCWSELARAAGRTLRPRPAHGPKQVAPR